MDIEQLKRKFPTKEKDAAARARKAKALRQIAHGFFYCFGSDMML